MKYEVVEKQRRLVRLWGVVRDGLPSMGRYRRYVVALAPGLLAIWDADDPVHSFQSAKLYQPDDLDPAGTGVGGSINLDTIGQASTVTSSAFSGSTLSPTENYKRLLMADITLRRAGATRA